MVILEKPQDVKCFEGESATFVCLVSSSDLPHVQWCLDHIIHSCTVRALTPRDSGIVSVVAGDQEVYSYSHIQI